jgi:subtilisin family serine protease
VGINRPSRLMIVLFLLSAIALLPQAIAGAAPPGNVPGGHDSSRVIVVFHDWVTQPGQVAQQMARSQNAQVLFVYEHALKGFAADVPAQAAAAFARDSRVAFVEADQPVYAFSDIPTGVDRIEADKNTTDGVIGNSKVVDIDIAIIDTGIDHNHPDLNVVGGVDCTGGGPFNAKCSDGLTGDGNGHGTHVAGTAAARDNGSQAVGVAPGARLYAVKVLKNDGSGWISGIVAGVDWVTARAGTIEVANMSLGCECSSSALDQALTKSTEAGVVYVVAAGNSAKDAATFSPANHPRVITVSAMADFDGKAGGDADPTCRSDVGADDTFATFSNYGSKVDIAAPGVCINSTVPGGGYAMYSGTSMASPHVAGAAALYVKQFNVGKSSTRWSQVRNGLVSSWSVSQSDPCGFSGGKSNEPFLMLADCDFTGDSGDPGDPGDPGEAEIGAITGTVTDQGGNPIAGATVTVNADGAEPQDASDGTFEFTDVPVGTYEVTASAEGFVSETREVTVSADESVSVPFVLSAVSPQPDLGQLAVTVTTDKTTYSMGETVVITVTVNHGDAVDTSGADVSIQIVTASGRIYTGSSKTGENGTAPFSFKIKRPDGFGTYTVTANASMTDYEAGSDATTFNVN